MEPNDKPPEKPSEELATFDDHKTLLTARQKVFCQEYVHLGVATSAFRRAYGELNRNGVKRSQAGVLIASKRLMKKPKIQREIQAIQETAKSALTIKAEDVARANIQAGFVDIADFFTATADGKTRCLLPHELPAELRNCVREVSVEQHEIRPRGQPKDQKPDVLYELVKITYKMVDPLKARDSLARQMGWDKPVKPLEQLLAHLSPELRARVWAELEPIIKREGD